MGKGEIACHKQFLLFPQCFQKAHTADMQKPELVWERMKALLNIVAVRLLKPVHLSALYRRTLFTSTWHNILSNLLAAFPYNHRQQMETSDLMFYCHREKQRQLQRIKIKIRRPKMFGLILDLFETILMSTHNIGFGRELMDVECHYSLLSWISGRRLGHLHLNPFPNQKF